MSPERSIAGMISESAGELPAGEDVLLEPGVGIPGPVHQADGVHEHDAVRLQQLAALAKVGVVEARAHVLEHADRDDTVEGAFHVAVVLQREAHRVLKPALARALGGDAELLGR